MVFLLAVLCTHSFLFNSLQHWTNRGWAQTEWFNIINRLLVVIIITSHLTSWACWREQGTSDKLFVSDFRTRRSSWRPRKNRYERGQTRSRGDASCHHTRGSLLHNVHHILALILGYLCHVTFFKEDYKINSYPELRDVGLQTLCVGTDRRAPSISCYSFGQCTFEFQGRKFPTTESLSSNRPRRPV